MGHVSRPRLRRQIWVAGLVLGACGLLATGCVFDHSGIPLWPEYKWRADGTLYLYGALPAIAPKQADDPTSAFFVTKNGGASPYRKWARFEATTALYEAPHAYVPSGIRDYLKGAFLLQLDAADRGETRSDFLTLDLSATDADRIYIGFDNRARTGATLDPPDWLTSDFRQVQASKQFFWSTEKSSIGNPVSYAMFEPKAGHAAYLSSPITLGGNNGAGVHWAQELGGNPGAQYLVFVRRAVRRDTSSKASKGGIQIHACSSKVAWIDAADVTAAKDEAISTWLEKQGSPADLVAAKDQNRLDIELVTVGGAIAWQSVTQNGVAVQCSSDTNSTGSTLIAAWPRASIGEVRPAGSRLELRVVGETSWQTSALSGAIEFDVGSEGSAEIYTLDVSGSSLSVPVDGHTMQVSGLSLGSTFPVPALCPAGNGGVAHTLCDSYTVPTGGLTLTVSAAVDGNRILMSVRNQSDLALAVDTAAMTFSMAGGPLTGSIEISGDTYQVEGMLQVAGPFTNLAPVAQLAEPVLEVECVDNDTAPVSLSANAFDQLHPGSIADLRWYEDAGAVTQRLLAAGPYQTTLVVPMTFGVHQMTLEVEDTSGVIADEHFEVAVVDTRIDVVNPPPDLWAMSGPLPSGGVGASLCVGQATADDNCSGSVLIDREGPACGDFPVGVSVVEWRFDDLRGNVVRHPQQIFVVDSGFYPPPISEALVSAGVVTPGGAQTIVHETHPQGSASRLDEYILLRGPDGSRWSIDERGDLRREEIVPHRSEWVVGAAPTHDVVYSDILGDELGEEGEYVVEASLVVPGGSPEVAEDVVARSWAPFGFERP